MSSKFTAKFTAKCTAKFAAVAASWFPGKVGPQAERSVLPSDRLRWRFPSARTNRSPTYLQIS